MTKEEKELLERLEKKIDELSVRPIIVPIIVEKVIKEPVYVPQYIETYPQWPTWPQPMWVTCGTDAADIVPLTTTTCMVN